MGHNTRNRSKWRCLISLSALLCLQSIASGGAEGVEYSPLDDARIVGPADMPELIVPMDTPGWAADLGITGVERIYKGICGPDGAVISIEDLMRVAERDLAMRSQQNRAVVTEIVGESPAFAMTYNDSDPVLPVLYMPAVRRAAEYVDKSLDNRVQIGASIALGTFGGSTMGSVSSVRFKIPWAVYVRGLRVQSNREDPRFAAFLPDSALNVLYQGSTTPTSETDIRVTSAQLRAIFGDNVVPQGEAVSITFNSGVFWNYYGCDFDPIGVQVSLIDVAVHEFTHALGFTSGIREGGINPELDIQGLDVARFRFRDAPFNSTQFGTNPRIGGEFTGEPHFYVSTPTTLLLESGDGNQPSHLNFESNPADKLGVMDPVLNNGTTLCPSFYSANDLQPLDDMGWRPTIGNRLADCNGNGQFDLLDILFGVSQDVDNDSIPDECETFSDGLLNASSPRGVRRYVYEAPGLTDLAQFVPNGPNSPLVASTFVTDMNDSLSFPNSDTRVVDYDFWMLVHGRDEYAFRLAHPADMILAIDDIVIDSSTESGQLTRGSATTNISSQSFIQLEDRWHRVHVRVLVNTSTALVRLVRESRGIGGWEDIPSSHIHRMGFLDCDNNGQHDGIDNNIDLNTITNLGVHGVADEPITLTTLNSDYDTMMALWDADGILITSNDNNPTPGDLTSEITQTLDAGTYFVAIAGWVSTFADGPSVGQIAGCRDGGDLRFNIDGALVFNGFVPIGRFRMFSFTVGDAPDCDNDGIPDSREVDCNGDGIPDDCQVPTIAQAIDVGVIGDSEETIIISTCGSLFDTELALWDEAGTLLSFNDDFCGLQGLQSSIETSLPTGTYYVAIAAFDSAFGGGYEINVNASGCSDAGDYEIQIGSSSGSGELEAGQAIMFRFDIEEPAGCSPADLNEDGVLNFFDVSIFLSAFAAQESIADFTGDGVFNFFDVSAFLTAFSAGCP